MNRTQPNTLKGLALAGTLLLGLLLTFSGAWASEQSTGQHMGSIHVMSPWVRAVPPVSKTTAVFMMIENAGGADDVLLGAEVPWAEKVEVHTVTKKDGMMEMHPVEQPLVLPKDGMLVLKPGGYHLMVMGLKRVPANGESVPVTLIFQGAGKVSFDAQVQEGPQGKMDSHAMDKMHGKKEKKDKMKH